MIIKRYVQEMMTYQLQECAFDIGNVLKNDLLTILLQSSFNYVLGRTIKFIQQSINEYQWWHYATHRFTIPEFSKK